MPTFILLCFLYIGVLSVPEELTVHTPGGETVLLEGYNSHQEFFATLQTLIERKVQAGTESWLHYSKLKTEKLLANSSINANQYLFIQLIQSLIARDTVFTNLLLEQFTEVYSDQKPILNELVRSNLKLPTDVMYHLVESISNPKSLGLLKIPESISDEILRITNKFEVFLESCKKGDMKIVEWLLKIGIDFELGRPLEVAWQNMQWDIVKILIHNGALKTTKVQNRFINTGNVTLLHLVTAANVSEAVSVLVNAGIAINEVDARGASPLYIAIESNNLDAAKILLLNGADTNLKTSSGKTALHAATSNGNLNAVKLLLYQNSSINETNNLGLTPLDIADQSSIFYIVKYFLHHNIRLPDTIISDTTLLRYIFFLSEYGLLLHEEDTKQIENYCKIARLMNNRTSRLSFEKELKYELLKIAVLHKIPFLTQCLINLGGNLNTTNGNNETLLFYAVQGGSIEIVKLLLDEGISVNAKDVNGMTALHIASGNGLLDMISCLLERGADINTVSHDGFTALHLAAKEGHNAAVDYLLEKGIRIDNIKRPNDKFIYETPLQLAASQGHLKVVKNLLNRSIFKDVKSNETWTTIHAAARAGQDNIVRLLLDRGYHVDIADHEGKTPLFWAAYGGSAPTVMTLLQRGADIHTKSNFLQLNPNDANGFTIPLKSAETPLHVAAWGGHEDICKILIDKGINKNVKDAVGETPLHNAASCGHYNATRFLIEIRVRKNARNLNGTTALHLAAVGSHLDIVDLLFDKGMDIDVPSSTKETPLFSAALAGRLDAVKHLIDKLAEVNAANIHGQTPLTAAVIGGHYEMALFLLDKGAKVDIIDSNGNEIVMEAISHGFEDITKLLIDQGASLFTDIKRKDGFSVMHIAAKGSPSMVKVLLNYKVSLEAFSAVGTSPLHEAVRWNNEGVVKALFNFGYPLDTNNTRTDDNRSCLHTAVINRSQKMVTLLLDNKASINPLDKDGDTPLHLAVKIGSYEITKMLLDRGADVNIKNNRGQTPFHVAKENNRKEILNLRLCDCEINL